MNLKLILRAQWCVAAAITVIACISGAAQKPELYVQVGHSSVVTSVAFSSDGRMLATGSSDRTIKFWDVASGRELKTLKGHMSEVLSLEFSIDGQILASSSSDKTIKIWEAATGKELKTLEGHPDMVMSIAFSPDGKRLLSGSVNTTIVWDVTTGRPIMTLGKLPDAISLGERRAVAYSPDGKTLASGYGEFSRATIRLWDASNGAALKNLSGHSETVTSIRFSPDGQILATGSLDQTIRLWDVKTGKELRTLIDQTEPRYAVYAITFSPDGKTLVSGSHEGTARLWDVATGRELRTFAAPVADSVWSVAFSPDGKTLATGNEYRTAKLWDVASGKELRTLKPHSTFVSSLTFSPDGRTLATGMNRAVRLWDLVSGQSSKSLHGLTGFVDTVVFSPDGKLLATGAASHTVKVWDVATGRQIREFENFVSSQNSLAFSPDGKILLTGGGNGALAFWDIASAKELKLIKNPPKQKVVSVAFSPDGHTVACSLSAHYDSVTGLYGVTKIFDIRSGAELKTLVGHKTGAHTVVFSPDGSMLATAAGDDTVKLWQVSTGREIKTIAVQTDSMNSISFNPDGRMVATGGSEGIRFFQVDSGLEIKRFGRERVSSVAFNQSGTLLATAINPAKTSVWDPATGQKLIDLIAIDEHDWMVATEDGLFDGSPGAWNKIIWRFSDNTFDYQPVEAYFSDFYYPGLLSEIFTANRPRAPAQISQKDRRQPHLRLALSNPSAPQPLTARRVEVRVDVSQAPAGAKDVRLFRNGSLVKVWHGDVLKGQTNITLDASVPIIAGENRLTAYAFNRDNIKSEDATLIITAADSLKRKGVAYVLAVGVNKYANPQYNLKYAVADADEFSEEIKRQQAGLNNYERVEITSLTDSNATKNSILESLSRLTASVQPEDALIIFFAGHGTAQGKRFYLIPHDLGYLGSRIRLNRIGLQNILTHSISDEELQKAVEGIDAGQLLLVIDACNSGQALEAEEKRRGPMNSKGLAQLAYEKGMYVMTAAQSYQAALEAAKFGHGYLTHALVVEGLKKGSADREPKNGAIDIREWLNFALDEVPKLQENNSREALRGRSRFIFFVGDGRREGFPKTEVDIRDNIQRPRIFYRRELEANPFVVGAVGAGAPR